MADAVSGLVAAFPFVQGRLQVAPEEDELVSRRQHVGVANVLGEVKVNYPGARRNYFGVVQGVAGVMDDVHYGVW